MRLVRVTIQNFKSVEDSDEFTVDQVTCLVGKNESGKTALLEALYKLNPVEADKAEFHEEEFPRRHLSTYRERSEREPANVLTTVWSLGESDVSLVAEHIHPATLASNEVVVRKGYDNAVHWEIDLDEKPLIDTLLVEANLNAAEKAQIAKSSTIRELISTLEGLDHPTEKQSAILNRAKEFCPDGDLNRVVGRILEDTMSHFVYFSTYHQLPGRVSVSELLRRKQNQNLFFEDKVFLSLLEMANTSIEDIQSLEQLEKLVMELEAVEASLTDEIKRYWSQNRHLEVRFRFDHARPGDPPPFNEGFVFNIRIFNTRHRATVSFEQRSHGFIWFFSFLIWFSQVKREYGNSLILLLDEPGLPLHGRAQQDLLRYINDRLRPKHQVIYTAHSPFLIDVQNIFSIRSVEDVVIRSKSDGDATEVVVGTKVGERILSRDKETLFPLQGILGFDITQTLFVGPYVLVVEGPTERAVLDWFSRQLAIRGREALDLRWAICPSEGAPKISSFVTLFAGRGLTIAVLADYHKGQKRLIDQLEQSGLLPEGHILRTSDFVHDERSDIEDLIGRDLYIHLVNRAMGLASAHELPKVRPKHADQRVVKEVEAHCRTLPPGYPEFDHYKPIRYLLSLKKSDIDSLPRLDQALGRFEAIFHKLNLIIPAEDSTA